ncbi:MAG: hypothetical protein GFH27_549279n422 [Chloroflexi bacterium AL-W]|nr:hypothetical protein [Chloroflexi bacterium AL-N1]NOK65388.1 hypothetical protein [Chloroflexi bacterium AL-N10]NOK72346.1 hypothetical protein [Chloroflexi bacterium AL-N5]NOK79567.1 hypothetical protein [Chloroflexi bacterium AL-W]NOK87483.1 hypothetical protein [Chloroflexi bacterium AL-N15]
MGIAEVYRYTVTARYSYDFSIANIYGHTTEQDSWWAWFYDGEDWFTRDNDTAHAKAVATGHYRHYNSGNTSDPTIVFDVFKDGKCDVDGA